MIVNDKYKIQSELGSGAFGKLYMGKHIYTGDSVAIKLQSDDGAVIIQNEARILKLLLDVEGVPKIKSFGKQDGIYYMVIELLSEPVERFFKNIGIRDILSNMIELVRIIENVHNIGVIHRDIKPGNIMITPDGKVKVTDFGIVSLQNEESDITKTGSILGTASYISPEQAQGKPVSKESDLYSLGTVLYELITGRPPFEGDTPIATATKHITDKPEKLSTYRADIPKGIENAVLKLLHKYPKDRFKNAEDLRAVLLQQKTQLQAIQTQENLVDLTSPKIKYRFTLPALIISLSIVIGTIWTLARIFDGLPVDGGAQVVINVPDLTGSSQTEALNDLQNLGFKVGIENSAHPEVPEGSVIRTQPPANTSTNPDTLVTIIVSVGPEAYPIPYVVDLETERAVYVIEESGFIVGQKIEVNDDNVPIGYIISQNPIAGKKMGPGSTVDLVVSSGPSLIVLSDLSKKSVEDATQILNTLGLEFETIEEFSEDIEEGLVSGTIPEAGEVITPDDIVTVIVSLGIKIEVPEVEGLTYQDAINKLEEVGLVATISGDTNGIVRKQLPRKGEFLEPEGVVELTFDE